jgi:hypothetical protein
MQARRKKTLTLPSPAYNAGEGRKKTREAQGCGVGVIEKKAAGDAVPTGAKRLPYAAAEIP